MTDAHRMPAALVLHLTLRVLGWILLVLLLVGGLAILAGTVEGASFGLWDAVRLAGLEALALIVPLVCVACALGAGVAAARLHSRGEALALESVGLAPRRLAMIPLVVGLVVGAVGLGLHSTLVPRAAVAARELRVELGSAEAPTGWLWTGQQALRLVDGAAVSVQWSTAAEPAGPRLLLRRGGAPPSGPLLGRARALQDPGMAAPADLVRDSRPLQVEWAVRWLRMLACGLLGALAWLGPGRRWTQRLAPALALALGWQAVASSGAALAAGGQLSVLAGTVGPVLLLVVLLAWRLSR